MKKKEMKLIKNSKNFKIKFIILLSYLICWLSISTSFNDLTSIFKNYNFDIFELINFVRHILVYILFFITFYLTTIFFKFSKENLKLNIIYVLIFFYFALQIPGLIYTENSLKNISFVISSLTILFTIILFNIFFSKKEGYILILVSIILLSFVFLAKCIPDLVEFLKGKTTLYGTFDPNSTTFLNKNQPRSSGLARTILFIIIMIEALNFNRNINRSLLDIFRISVITLILLFQSRLIIFLSFIYLFFLFFFEKELIFKNIFKYSLKFIFVPCVIFSLLMFNYTYQKNQNNKFDNNEKLKIIQGSKKNLRPIESFSSGRFDDWKNILIKYDKKKIFGYGSQGDRYLINQSASNGIIYALSSSGIIGLISYILFSLMIFKFSLKNIILKNSFKNAYVYYLNLLVLISLLRSIFESGYAVFSIDLIVFLTCLSQITINSKIKK